MYAISIVRDGRTLARAQGEHGAALLYTGAYVPGDVLEFESGSAFAVVQVGQQVAPARVYLPKRRFAYRLPLAGDGLAVYAPGAFGGEKHLISIREDAALGVRNLARNPADQRGDVDAYPHATANVETRNESVFAARNAIDGQHIACGHGAWPFGSWGIGARTDAEMTVDFGREVEVEAVTLYLRADFPHDAYWTRASLSFDDGQTVTFPLQGIDGPQRIDVGTHVTRTVRLHDMVKCDMPSAFPALRQIEVWGRDRGEC